MAFDRSKLQRVIPTSPGIWAYDPGADNAATVKAADYFLAATTELVVGDQIHVLRAAPQILGVASNTGSTVTTAYLTNA